MADFYKREIAKWIVATDDLNLEQEAAYSRVVDMIRLYERPFRHNLRVLSGMWRCNERKAKRLLAELVEAGKLSIEDGFIIDEKAVKEASTLRQSRIDAQLSGRRGGIESGKSRRKSLENNETDEGYPSTRVEKRREDIGGGGGARARDHAPTHTREDDPPTESLVSMPDDAVALYESVMAACGVRNDITPTYWMPPTAIIEVARWRGLGLTDEEIIEVAKGSRRAKREPPNGPKALERFMAIAASVKADRRSKSLGEGHHDRHSDNGSEALRRSLERAAKPDKGLDFW